MIVIGERKFCVGEMAPFLVSPWTYSVSLFFMYFDGARYDRIMSPGDAMYNKQKCYLFTAIMLSGEVDE